MTTNSPNPVDGDVQALIEHIKTQLDPLRIVTNEHVDEFQIEDIKMDIKVHKIALAALTAEPVIYAIQNEEERKNGYITEFSSSGIAGYVNPEKYGLTELPLYTTPPAQLLRPVELPEFKVHSNQPCWPSLTVGLRDKEWIEALRQQGYEVKK